MIFLPHTQTNFVGGGGGVSENNTAHSAIFDSKCRLRRKVFKRIASIHSLIHSQNFCLVFFLICARRP